MRERLVNSTKLKKETEKRKQTLGHLQQPDITISINPRALSKLLGIDYPRYLRDVIEGGLFEEKEDPLNHKRVLISGAEFQTLRGLVKPGYTSN